MSLNFNGTTFTGTNASHQVNFNGTSMCTVADANCNIRFDHQDACVAGGSWNCICPNWNLYSRCYWFIQGGTSTACRVSPRTTFNAYFRSWNPVSCCSCIYPVVYYQHSYPYSGMRCHNIIICQCCMNFSGQVNFNNCCGYTSFALGFGSVVTNGYSSCCLCTNYTSWTCWGSLAANCASHQFSTFVPNPASTITCARLRVRLSPNCVVAIGCPFIGPTVWSSNNTYNMIIPADVIPWNWITGCTFAQVQSCVAQHTNNFMKSFTGNNQSIGTIGFIDYWAPSYLVCTQDINTINCPLYAALYNFRNNINVSMGSGDMWYTTCYGCSCPKGNCFQYVGKNSTCISV